MLTFISVKTSDEKIHILSLAVKADIIFFYFRGLFFESSLSYFRRCKNFSFSERWFGSMLKRQAWIIKIIINERTKLEIRVFPFFFSSS